VHSEKVFFLKTFVLSNIEEVEEVKLKFCTLVLH